MEEKVKSFETELAVDRTHLSEIERPWHMNVQL